MKRLLIIASLMSSCSMVAEAGNRSCCQTAQKNCCSTACCSTTSGCSTQWYKAKDGTFREMVPYMEALSRAEDADDMEIKLKGVQQQFEAASAESEAIKAETAKLKAEMETQIAELKQQLDAERQAVAAQKDRGDKAEAAHKQAVEQVAMLRDSEKKNEESRKAGETEFKKVSEERDGLKVAKADLEKALSEMTAARTSVEEAAKATQQELAKLKQEAAEAKKAKVEEEPAPEDAPKPDDAPKSDEEKPATDGGDAPGEEPPKN